MRSPRSFAVLVLAVILLGCEIKLSTQVCTKLTDCSVDPNADFYPPTGVIDGPFGISASSCTCDLIIETKSLSADALVTLYFPTIDFPSDLDEIRVFDDDAGEETLIIAPRLNGMPFPVIAQSFFSLTDTFKIKVVLTDEGDAPFQAMYVVVDSPTNMVNSVYCSGTGGGSAGIKNGCPILTGSSPIHHEGSGTWAIEHQMTVVGWSTDATCDYPHVQYVHQIYEIVSTVYGLVPPQSDTFNTWTACVSKDGGLSYVRQEMVTPLTTLDEIPASNSFRLDTNPTYVALTDATIDTPIPITHTWRPGGNRHLYSTLASAALSWVDKASTCDVGPRFAYVPYPLDVVTSIPAIPVPGEYMACLTIGTGWVAQTTADISVRLATANVVTAVFPRVIERDVSTTLTLSGQHLRDGDEIAIRGFLGDCVGLGAGAVVSANEAVVTVNLGAGPFYTGMICYRPLGFVDYIAQSAHVDVVALTATAVNDIIPNNVLKTKNSQDMVVTLSQNLGQFRDTTHRIAFCADAEIPCHMCNLVNNRPLSHDGRFTVGPWISGAITNLCLTINNGATWHKQAVTLYVENNDVLGSISPIDFGGTDVDFFLTGLRPLREVSNSVRFSEGSDNECTVGASYSAFFFGTNPTVSATFGALPYGPYRVCLSDGNGGYTPTTFEVSRHEITSGGVTDITPRVVRQGHLSRLVLDLSSLLKVFSYTEARLALDGDPNTFCPLGHAVTVISNSPTQASIYSHFDANPFDGVTGSAFARVCLRNGPLDAWVMVGPAVTVVGDTTPTAMAGFLSVHPGYSGGSGIRGIAGVNGYDKWAVAWDDEGCGAENWIVSPADIPNTSAFDSVVVLTNDAFTFVTPNQYQREIVACWTPLEGVVPYQPVTGTNSHGMFAASRKLLTGADVDVVAVGDPISSFNTDVSSSSARNDLTTLGLSPLHTRCGSEVTWVPYNQSFATEFITFPALGEEGYYVWCLSRGLGQWQEQALPLVYASNTTESTYVALIDPTFVAVGDVASISLAFGPHARTAPHLAFAADGIGVECDTAPLFALTNLTGSGPWPLASALPTEGSYKVCYSPDGPSGPWYEQVNSGVSMTALQADDGDVSLLSPARVPSGLAVSVAAGGVTGSPITWLAWTQTDCLAPVSPAVVTVGTITAHNVTLGATGNWQACLSYDSGASYVLMTGAAARLEVITIDDTTVGSVSPSRVGLGSGVAVDLDGLPGSPFTQIALVASGGTCGVDPHLNTRTLTTDGGPLVIDDPSLTSGIYRLCLTLDGVWVEQITPALEVIAAGPSRITSVSPPAIGTLTTPEMTFVGVDLSSTTAVGFSTSVNCTGAVEGVTVLNVTATNVPLASPLGISGNLTVCYTVAHGVLNPLWVPQGLVSPFRVAAATQGSITDLQPRVFAADVLEYFTIAGAVVTGSVGDQLTSLVSFVFSAADCSPTGLRYGETELSAAGTFSLTAPVGIAGSVVRLCYSTSGGVQWAVQTQFTVAVVAATSTSLSAVAPVLIGSGEPTTFTFVGTNAVLSTARVAFSNDNCASTIVEAPMTESTNVVMTVPAGVSYASMATCYSTNGGTAWLPQLLLAGVRAVGALPDSMGTVGPSKIGAGWEPTFSIAGNGSPLPPNATVGWDNAGGDCSAPTHVAPLTALSAVTVTGGFATPGPRIACYSVDGGLSFVPQPAANVSVVVADTASVASFAPVSVATDKAVNSFAMALSGDGVRTPTTRLAFSLDQTCATGLVNAVEVTEDSFALPSAFATGGNYTLCLSLSDAGPYAPQTALVPRLAVVFASPTDVAAVVPSVVSRDSTPVLELVGARITPSSVFAFAETGRCDFSLERHGQTSYTAGGAVTLASALDIPGRSANLSVCFSVNGGATWVEQTRAWLYVTDECERTADCERCAENALCTWCLSDVTCKLTVDDAFCPPVDQVSSDPGLCPSLGALEPESGASVGGTVVTVTGTQFPTLSHEPLFCRWSFGGLAFNTPLTIVSGMAGECESVAQEADVPAATLSLVTAGLAPYASGSAFFVYYRCSDFETDCATCVNAAAFECGFCVGTGTCEPERTCPSWLWDGALCPAVTGVDPSSVAAGGSETVSLTGRLFLNSSEIECGFGGVDSDGDEVVALVPLDSWDGPGQVTCTPPAGSPGDVVTVGLYRGGEVFTVETASLLYASDPDAVVDAGLGTSLLLIIILAALAVLLLCIALCLWEHRRRSRVSYLPPKLTVKATNEIVFGNIRHLPNEATAARHVMPLVTDLLVNPDLALLHALVAVTASTETDIVSKALVTLFEREQMCVPVIKELITQEVAASTHLSTLFRTNSFATKLFKTFSKIVGLPYVHETLGYEMNYNIHKYADTNLDIRDTKSEEERTLAKFNVLTICQRIFVAIVRSERRVPPAFREIFAHVRARMLIHFPIDINELARVVVEDVNENIEVTAASYHGAAETFGALQAQREHFVEDMGVLGQLVPEMTDHMMAFETHVTALDRQINRMRHNISDLKGALDPESDEARRLLMQHSNRQNSIAVGGFFFLRFLIPALTAPEAYHLNVDEVTVNQRRLLVLVGKVLQSLSNGTVLGAKETYLAGLNDFIESNRNKVYKLFDQLASPPEHGAVASEPLDVPDEIHGWAACVIYIHCMRNHEKILAALDEGSGPEARAHYEALMDRIGSDLQREGIVLQ